MDGARRARHDGADAALCSSRRSRTNVGDFYGLFIDKRRRREGVGAAVRRRVVDADLLVLLVQRLRLAALDAGKQLVLDVGGELDADRVGVVAVLVANVASVGPGRCLGLGRRAVVRGAVSPGGEEGCRLRVKIVSVPVAVGARREGAKGDVGREPGRGWRRNVGWLWGLISSSTRLQALKAERE